MGYGVLVYSGRRHAGGKGWLKSSLALRMRGASLDDAHILKKRSPALPQVNFSDEGTAQEKAREGCWPTPQGPKSASLGGLGTQVWASGGSGMASLQVFERSRLAGSDPGPRVDPDVGHGVPTQRAAPVRLQGSRSPRR